MPGKKRLGSASSSRWRTRPSMSVETLWVIIGMVWIGYSIWAEREAG